MPSIVIVDYGMGNLRSVQKALERLGFAAIISSQPEQLLQADKVILPGVGAFADAIARLHACRLDVALRQFIASGRPFLGICLGLQLLFTRSYEDGLHDGLNILPGEVVRFPEQPGLKVPHMGWNSLYLTRPDCPLFHDLPPEPSFYFVHSYYAMPHDPTIVAATTDYPTPFTAVVWKDHIMATQFHPEKSQHLGLQMLANFARL
jgi:glutamine amidotransferase